MGGLRSALYVLCLALEEFEGASVVGVVAAVGGGEEGGDLAHDFGRVFLEGFVAVLFGEGRQGKRGTDVDEEVEFLEVFEAIGDEVVFGAMHGGGEDRDASPRGQVRGSRFAFEKGFGAGAGAFGGDHQ